jgi:hypothetical protein
MPLPKITPQQQAILRLIYRYRFLNRIQIQAMLGHKDYKRINIWLADLRSKAYITWIYSTNFLEKSKPAVYFIGLNGIRYLKTTTDYPESEFRNRYRDSARSQTFIDQSIMLGDMVLLLERYAADRLSSGLSYRYAVKADYLSPKSPYNFLNDTGLIDPDFALVRMKRDGQATTALTFLLEIIEPALPRYRFRKRVKNYIEYLTNGDWPADCRMGEQNPVPLFVCPTMAELVYAKRMTRKLLAAVYADDIQLSFTTIDRFQKEGITGSIWQAVVPPSGDNDTEDDDEDE